METVTDFIFLDSKFTADSDCSHEIRRCLFLGRKAMTELDRVLKIRDISLPTKICIIKAIVFPVVVYGCESGTMKKAECWRIDAFQMWYWRRLEGPLDSKEIKPVNPKAYQPSIFIWRTDAGRAILWPPDAKSQLIWKDPDAGKDWRQEKETTEDEMFGWHHWLKG